MFDITSLGELLIDFTPAGYSESGMVLYEQNPGGAPANVLTVMSKLGAKTAFLGKVGNDTHGYFLKKTIEQEGIQSRGLILDDKVYTTLAFVSLNPLGEREFSFSRKPGADTMLKKEELDLNLIKESKIFHVGSLSLCCEPSRGTTLFALEYAKEQGCIISYDPNYRALLWDNKENACHFMRMIIPFADVMKISDEETDLLTPYKAPEQAATYLVNQGVTIVVVTLGAKGAYVCTKSGGAMVTGFQSNVVDTTGAGDSFWGGFLYQFIEGKKALHEVTLDQAREYTLYANAVASLCVEKRGAIPSMPSKDEVKARLYQNPVLS